MGASQIEAGDMYVSQTGIFARDVLSVGGRIVHYRQYDYPQGRPRSVIQECTAESLWRWSGRLLGEAEAERIRGIGRPVLLEERARSEQSVWAAATDALVFAEFLKRGMADRLFQLANVSDACLRELLARVPDEEIASEVERRGLTFGRASAK